MRKVEVVRSVPPLVTFPWNTALPVPARSWLAVAKPESAIVTVALPAEPAPQSLMLLCGREGRAGAGDGQRADDAVADVDELDGRDVAAAGRLQVDAVVDGMRVGELQHRRAVVLQVDPREGVELPAAVDGGRAADERRVAGDAELAAAVDPHLACGLVEEIASAFARSNRC